MKAREGKMKGAAERARILGEGKELKDAGDSEPSDGFENEKCSRVACFYLPGTSTFPRSDNSLDFHGAGMGLASMLCGYFRERFPEL